MTAVKKFLPGKNREMDMTTGGIASNIIKYTFPLLVGNLLQQLYNMVDTWVIGQTGENAAYAAVGSVGPIINILVGFFLGLSSGAGVVISRYYGAKNEKRVHDAVHTSILMTLILGVLFTAVGIIMTPYILEIMLHSESDADEIFPFARQYLIIIFAGVLGLMMYNIISGILRAIGDSVRPFYFLVVSAVINTVLDLVFVFVFDMGVAGVAAATVTAQLVSAVLGLVTIMRTPTCVRLNLRELKIDFSVLGSIVKIGFPAALQLSITSFSNMFVQSYIAGVNLDKTYCLGAWTTYSKVDQLLYLPSQSLALAVTTFVSQNLGNDDPARAKKGLYVSYAIATGITVFFAALILVFAPGLSAVFNPDENVVKYSTILLRNLTPFYLFTCVNQLFAAAMRGAGNSRAPMIIMLSAFVGFRQVYLFIVTNYISNELLPVAFGYPAGWFVCCVSMLIYYKFFFHIEKSRKLA